MRRAVVPAQPRGERHPTLDVVALLEPHVPREMPHAVFDALGNLGQAHAGLDGALGPFAHLSVHFGALSQVAGFIRICALEMALLLARGAIGIRVFVVHLLADGVVAVREEIGDLDAGWGGLAFGS